jgi:hypothetical protein
VLPTGEELLLFGRNVVPSMSRSSSPRFKVSHSEPIRNNNQNRPQTITANPQESNNFNSCVRDVRKVETVTDLCAA